MVQRPTLAQADIDPVRQLLLFELASLLDNPSRRVINELNRCYYPSPYGRPLEGDAEGLAKITDRDVRDAWQRYFVPDGAVLSVAGNVNPSELLKNVKDLFSDFTGKKVARPTFGSVLTGARDHVPSETAQLQIAIAIPSVGPTDPLYYAARLAVGVLHTGMGGRLFIEVREKRGLCYAVHARMVATRESGMLRIYAGTTPERAHETLTVIQDELAELASTVTHEELERARTGLKALLVIGDESPQVRSSSNLVDVWIFGRVRSNKEIESALNEITVERVSDYLAAYSVNNATIVTLGSTR
jgi:predicted Zn-dependent peptidase